MLEAVLGTSTSLLVVVRGEFQLQAPDARVTAERQKGGGQGPGGLSLCVPHFLSQACIWLQWGRLARELKVWDFIL